MKLYNVLKSGVLYLCVIAVLYKNFINIWEVEETQIWIPMVELNHGGYTSSESSATMSGATHTTGTTDNVSLNRLGQLDSLGYPRHDARIDGSHIHWYDRWYKPKREYKVKEKAFGPPSIGSSGEIDHLSYGRSRSIPANIPQWSYHTGSTESIFVPKADDARYY